MNINVFVYKFSDLNYCYPQISIVFLLFISNFVISPCWSTILLFVYNFVVCLQFCYLSTILLFVYNFVICL